MNVESNIIIILERYFFLLLLLLLSLYVYIKRRYYITSSIYNVLILNHESTHNLVIYVHKPQYLYLYYIVVSSEYFRLHKQYQSHKHRKKKLSGHRRNHSHCSTYESLKLYFIPSISLLRSVVLRWTCKT